MLISFEGVDGSGKSTQIELLRERLTDAGRDVVVVREPGGTRLSEQIRDILLDTDNSIAPFTELLLFSAARAQLVVDVVRPRMAEGYVVICDRFTDSTLAYQGGGRAAASLEWLREFNLRVTDGLVPDRTYYLAIDPEEARSRYADVDDDRMEAAGRSFFDRVADAYERVASEEPDRVVRLNARARRAAIHDEIWKDLARNL